jgi:hypothetical protein
MSIGNDYSAAMSLETSLYHLQNLHHRHLVDVKIGVNTIYCQRDENKFFALTFFLIIQGTDWSWLENLCLRVN